MLIYILGKYVLYYVGNIKIFSFLLEERMWFHHFNVVMEGIRILNSISWMLLHYYGQSGITYLMYIESLHSTNFYIRRFLIKWHTPKSRFNKARFNEIPRFSEQMPAPFYYFYIVNSIRFSESLDLVNKSGLTEPIR